MESFKGFTEYLPPLLGGLICLIAFWIARSVWDTRTGIAAGLLAAFAPGAVKFSRLGALDRHVFDCFWLCLSILALIKALKGSRRWAVLAGLALTGLQLTWLGSPMITGFLGLFLIVSALFQDDAAVATQLRIGAIAFLASAVSLIALVPFGALTAGFTFQAVSFLHLAFLLGFAVGFLGLGQLLKARGMTWLRSGALGFFLLAAVAVLAIPPLRVQLILGLRKAFGLYPIARYISEWMPIWITDSKFSLDKVYRHYSYALPLLLILFVPAGLEAWRQRDKSAAPVLLLFWSVGLMTMGSFSTYYYPLAIIPLLIIAARGLVATVAKIPGPGSTGRMFRGFGLATCLILLLALFLPPAVAHRPTLSPDMASVFSRLKTSTPDDDAYRIDRKPAYSVMAPWSYGQYIISYSERASVANGNFESCFGGFLEQQRFFDARSEDEALAIAQRNGARYVLVGRLHGITIGDPADANPALRDNSGLKFVVSDGVGELAKYPWIAKTMWYRMWHDGGLAVPALSLARLKHFRMLWDSDSGAEYFQLWEVNW
jgi:asparagine N-glycosylation enzyme membrane subunit Stt3